MRFGRINEVGVELPFLGISSSWSPNDEEKQAAFKLLVELVTRTSVNHMADDEGSDQAALTSLYSLFSTTREILREHGIDTGSDRRDGSLPFATVAIRMLNEIIRPFTTRWHPLLEAHHAGNDPRVPAAEWEQTAWGGPGAPLHVEFRQDLAEVRDRLRQLIFVLARAAGTLEFGSSVEVDAARGGGGGGGVATAPPTEANQPPKPLEIRRHMVRWFDPWVGGASLYKLAFTTGDDRDDSPGSGPEFEPHPVGAGDGARSGDVWFDYAADMGDAFDPMMQVAWTIGRAELTLRPHDRPHEEEQLLRGEALILGGDEIYPYPGPGVYEKQLTNPFRMGFDPNHSAGDAEPKVFAIPGNHDWYGGLDQWRSVFCDAEEFAGRTAPQTESWWALQLPYGWWVWGLDTHLHNTINADQLDYFEAASTALQPGDQVIVCSPVPLWRLREKAPGDLAMMESFVRDLIESRDATARLYLAGDSHIFAAYERHRSNGVVETHLTSGGAGAFLQPTHNLAPVVPQTELRHPAESRIDRAPFVEGRFWPPRSQTHRFFDGKALAGVRDRQSALLVLVLSALHVGYGALAGGSPRSVTPAAGLGGLIDVFERLVVRWPGSLVTALMALIAIVAGARLAVPNTAERAVRRAARRIGAVHGLGQAVGFVLVAGLANWFGFQLAGDTWADWVPAVAAVAGGIAGAILSLSVLFLFLRFVNRRWRINDNEAFAAHHVMDGKHFLRFKLSPDRSITAYLVGIETVTRGWKEAIDADELLPPGSGTSDSNRRRPVPAATVPWSTAITPHVRPVRFRPDVNRLVAVSASMPDDAASESKAAIDEVFLQVAQLLLLAGFEVAYGGDHRRDGLTERLADAARGTIGFRGGRVHNYLTAEGKALVPDGRFIGGINIIDVDAGPGEHGEGEDVARGRNLSEMRRRMTEDCVAKVVIGGKFFDAAGFGPGVLEESFLAHQQGQPLVLLSRFGGVATAVSAMIGTRGRAAEADAELAKILARLEADGTYLERIRKAKRSSKPADQLRAFAGPPAKAKDGRPTARPKVITDDEPSQAARQVLAHLRGLVE